jgi:hypothetical protein
MRKLAYAFSISAVSGLTSFAGSSLATPMPGLFSGLAAQIVQEDDIFQNVHRWQDRWHCRKRYGKHRGRKYRHRHWQACDEHLGGYSGPFFEFYRGDHHHYDRPNRRKKKD